MQETLEIQVQSQGRGDPLEKNMATSVQYSCLENPMDRGAWQAKQSKWSQRVGQD